MELFRDKRYRHLYFAQVMALIGTGLTTVGLALLASELAGNRAGEVLGAALAIKMIAYVVIAPVVGAYATRLPRRALLVALDLMRALVVVSLPFVTAVWQVYVLIFLLNTFSAGFTPVFQATIPDIFEDERRYTKALSMSRLAYDLENLLSPLSAAMLLAVMSFNALFVLNAAAFMLSALLVVSVSLPSSQAPAKVVGGVWARLTQGTGIYLQTPRLRGLLALNMAVASAGAMQIVNTVVYVRHVLEAGEADVAIAFAAAGSGSMLIALSMSRLLKRLNQRAVMLAGGMLMSASLFGGLLSPGFNGLLLLWFVLGAGASMVMTPSGRLLKQSCQADERPVLFAAQFSLSHACWLIGYPLAGWLGASQGMAVAFAVLGTMALASTLAAMRLWPVRNATSAVHK